MELDGLYRDIVVGSADGFWVIDLEGNTVYANPALLAMFGYSEDEFGRLTAFDLLDEPGREQFSRHLDEALRGERHAQDVECMYLRADGSALWVLVSESPLRAPDGSLVALLHRVSDYSARRRILDELTESRRQLAEGQRIARIGTWEWDLARDQVTGSEGLRLLYGIADDFFPAAYEQVLASVHEADRDAMDAEVQRALAGADEFTFEARIEGEQEGEWIWTRGRGVVHRDGAGRALTVTGTHQDITEAKLAEVALEDQVVQNTLLQAIASAANEAHTLQDVLVQARALVLLHDDWERARAFVLAEDGAGVVPLYVRPDDRAADDATPVPTAVERDLANRAFLANESVWDEERLTIGFPIRYDGTVFAVITITSAPPLYRHDLIQQMAEQVAVQLGRVVEREIAQRELADARDGAMEASRQKSEFLATMSHEIRTPLNGVIGLNDLLLRTKLDADQHRLASGVQGASRALLGLITDILDFSKIEAGKLELESVDFEVRAVFDQVANLLGETARTKDLDLLVSCDRSVPEVLSGDPTRLAQVVTNLGSNAVKFTASGDVKVRATAEVADGKATLRVEVSDTGIGIDPSSADGLFDSFTQADASTTRVHGGTGLGLAISREIVHALGGEIGVDSMAGEGSIFWFTAVFDHPDGAESADDAHARTWLAGRRVLVIDGSEGNRRVICEQLEWWRIRWDAVASADEAELALEDAIVEGDPFDAVLIDRTLSLPRRSGLILARTLRSQRAYDDLPLLLTTSTTDLDFAAVRAGGIAETLSRPVSSQALRSALLHHVAGVEASPAPAPTVTPETGSRRRVLVVEDNPVNQMVAVGLLDALGYDAETADDGVEAVEIFDPERFDCVLMDVQMPRLDGYAATRAIRERGDARRVPVLAMTAAAIEGERERCLAAGMDDYLTKPVDPEALGAALTTWLSDEPADRPA
ncbi:MAG: response regulator [Nocardioides sp.]